MKADSSELGRTFQNLLKSGTVVFLPQIRYFDGTEKFSTPEGKYSSDTLAGSLELYLAELKK